MVLTANKLFPWNVLVQCLGIAGWLIVSVMWNDRALIIVNAVGVEHSFEWFCWLFTRGIILWQIM